MVYRTTTIAGDANVAGSTRLVDAGIDDADAWSTNTRTPNTDIARRTGLIEARINGANAGGTDTNSRYWTYNAAFRHAYRPAIDNSICRRHNTRKTQQHQRSIFIHDHFRSPMAERRLPTNKKSS